jgi:MOSC domain-containing protein YiiM
MIHVMKILSVNLGPPRQIVLDGKTVSTGIYKVPVRGRVKVGKLNLEGDAQADLSAHGGPNKALYAYPSEHYSYWRRELPGTELPWGAFGENLTLAGLLEEDVHIGDRFQIGTAVVMVTQPRLPCYKLGIRFGRGDMPDRFLASRRTGFYLSVLEEGELGEGDAVEWITQDLYGISVATVVRLYLERGFQDIHLLERALQVEALPSGWRKRFQKWIEDQREAGKGRGHSDLEIHRSHSGSHGS